MYHLYIGILLLGILTCLVNLGMLMIRQEKDSQGYLTIVLCVIILSLMSYIAEIRATDLPAKMIAIRMELTTDAFANAFFLFYILRFCDYKLNNGVRLLIFMLHVAGLSCLYFNDYHWLYYTSTTLVQQKDYVSIELTRGPIYFAYMFFNLLHMIVYEWACITRLRVSQGRARALYKRLMIVGIAPYICYLIYATGITGKYDITCFGFFAVAILLANTTIHYGFSNTVNIAKNKLINQMPEGFLVTDENGYFIYANPAALKMFPQLHHKEYAKEKILLEKFLDIRDNRICHNQSVYECTNIPVFEKKEKIGTMYMLHEITEIDKLVSRDSMTGLYNHKMFYSLLKNCIARYENQDRKIAIAFVDIDDFKMVNDRFGHDNGDAVILKLADIMKQYSGDKIYACRYGGEEFALIFEGEKAKDARAIMEKIQKAFQEYAFSFCEDRLTFSCAIQYYQSGQEIEEYFTQIDKLLYHIKRNGKRQILEKVR